MTDKETLEIAYKYSVDKLNKAKKLACCACQTLAEAVSRQTECEFEVNAIVDKLKTINDIEEVERRINRCH